MNPGEMKRRNQGGEAISPDLAGGTQGEGRPASQPVGAKFDKGPSDSPNAELCTILFPITRAAQMKACSVSVPVCKPSLATAPERA